MGDEQQRRAAEDRAEDESAPKEAEDDSKEAEDDSKEAEDEPEEAEAEDEAASPWRTKMQRARELWKAGNNAELRKVVEELEAAPESETEARELAAEMRHRLRPDPIAIALWLVTLAVFCLLTYLYVLR